MIEQSLVFTKSILDQFLQNRFDIRDDIVLINNIIEADGSIPQQNQNKVVISLINIQQETNQPYYSTSRKLPNGAFVNITPSDRFNLDLLISSQFDDYKETLKFLNASIMFFQANQSVDSSSYSNIPPGINKLSFVLDQLDYSQMHNLWSAMGAKYMPSVVYKMKLIDIQADEISGISSAVKQTSLEVE
ncbi:MAG: hypothetical protein COB15_15375 [Flavobacteriales bacterium]|nr:MAG: hypothetical protein COB15_15375 [Flavobacteriales bacterium]